MAEQFGAKVTWDDASSVLAVDLASGGGGAVPADFEAFHRILEDECLSMNEFSSFREAYTKVADCLDYYNTIRIHSSIGYLAPEDFYQATMSKTAIALLVRV